MGVDDSVVGGGAIGHGKGV